MITATTASPADFISSNRVLPSALGNRDLGGVSREVEEVLLRHLAVALRDQPRGDGEDHQAEGGHAGADGREVEHREPATDRLAAQRADDDVRRRAD
jgi:hypothetical protein